MPSSKDIKKEPATGINTRPDSSIMAFYGNAGTVEHHEPKGDISAYDYTEANQISNYASMTEDGIHATQDFNESFTESESGGETNLMPIEQNQGGFFYHWTYPLQNAKTGKHE